ncbi:MAG: hypothetical protein ACLQVD_06970 [Capsulimonadaceae bacterium]
MKKNLALAGLLVLVAATSVAAAPKAKLPYLLYPGPSAFLPTGWMGDHADIYLNPACTVQPHQGKTCMQNMFNGVGWAGVVWQDPANDWGSLPGGLNLTGAKKLTFWARGDTGKEVVTFIYGQLGASAKFHDSSTASLKDVHLTKAWKQYTINLAHKNLSCIISGFEWIVGSGPANFYLDKIQYQ